MVELIANSGDLDQTASDLGLHCLAVTCYGVSSLQSALKRRYFYWVMITTLMKYVAHFLPIFIVKTSLWKNFAEKFLGQQAFIKSVLSDLTAIFPTIWPNAKLICHQNSWIWLSVVASVAQLDAPSDLRPGGRRFNPRRGWQHSFMEIDHEIFSMVILSLPLIQEGWLSVSGERMCTILVNHLED